MAENQEEKTTQTNETPTEGEDKKTENKKESEKKEEKKADAKEETGKSEGQGQPLDDAEQSDLNQRRKALMDLRNQLGIFDQGKDGKSYSGRYQTPLDGGREDGINIYDEEHGFQGGFYYDAQLENPYLSMSLHANTAISSQGDWVKWREVYGEDQVLEMVTSSKTADDVNWSAEYGKAPIARCILSEDFSYSIANNFSDYNAGNPIEGIFEGMKPYAPMLTRWGDKMGSAIKEIKDSGNFGSKVVGNLSNWLGDTGMSGIMSKMGNYLNKALYVQGTRFSYYGGTQFNFNNMEMRFMVFSDYVNPSGDGKTWVFQSVEDYISRLQPYVMGNYAPYNASFLKNITGGWSETIDKTGNELQKFIKTYVGFQDPPGGFQMDTLNLDTVLKGTLRLNIGGTWAIENLVIKGMNVIMSKVQAKNPEKEGETVPLYAEVSLQLAPACAIIDTGYTRMMKHSGMSGLRESVTDGYKKRMNSLIEGLKTGKSSH